MYVIQCDVWILDMHTHWGGGGGESCQLHAERLSLSQRGWATVDIQTLKAGSQYDVRSCVALRLKRVQSILALRCIAACLHRTTLRNARPCVILWTSLNTHPSQLALPPVSLQVRDYTALLVAMVSWKQTVHVIRLLTQWLGAGLESVGTACTQPQAPGTAAARTDTRVGRGRNREIGRHHNDCRTKVL